MPGVRTALLVLVGLLCAAEAVAQGQSTNLVGTCQVGLRAEF
jgi:hypothetical protein